MKRLHKYLRLFLVIFISIYIIILISIFLSQFTFSTLDKADTFVQENYKFELNYVIWGANRYYMLVEGLNLFDFKKNLHDNTLPVYNLKLSKNDLEYLESTSKRWVQQGYKDDLDKWRSADITIKNKKYNVKIKLRGDSFNHWSGDLKSFRIKSDTNKFINHIRTFDLIIIEDRLLDPAISRILSGYLGLYDVRGEVVVLQINGVEQGVYYLQERFDDQFLEYNQCSNCVIVQPEDSVFMDHYATHNENGIYIHFSHATPFDNDISHIKISESLNDEQLLYKIYLLYKNIKERNSSKVLDNFNINQLSSLEALIRILGVRVVGDNLKMAYSFSTGKFYIIPSTEIITELDEDAIEHYIHKAYPEEDNIFHQLDQNEELRYLTNKKMYSFIINQGDSFLRDIENLTSRITPYILSSNMNQVSSNWMEFRLRNHKESVANNLNRIRESLEYSKLYINTISNKNHILLEILPDSVSRIKLSEVILLTDEPYTGEIKISSDDPTQDIIASKYFSNSTALNLTNLFEQLYFSADFDKDFYPAKKQYNVTISFEEVDHIYISNITFKAINEVTGKILPDKDVRINIANGDGFYEDIKYLSGTDFITKNPTLSWNYDPSINELRLKKGNYFITDDLIIPSFDSFRIEGGTQIKISHAKSIISYSPVSIQGTSSNPVVIQPINPSYPFGTFGVLVDDGLCKINLLDISGGSESYINGIFFSGGLSLYGCNSEISNSKIHDNHGDDGLNVKYAKINLTDNQFLNNYADHVDLDFVEGTVKNNQFNSLSNNLTDSNGDGLDLSGSKVIIRDNSFNGFSDKGISLGEKTEALVYKNNFLHNNISIAVKDLSTVFTVENSFYNNNYVISAYQKKGLFGGGIAYVFNNTKISNKEDYNFDKKSNISNITVDNDNLINSIEAQDIEHTFYLLFGYTN